MHPPFLPEFANPGQSLIGFGPSGAVGDAPIDLRGDFINFVKTGAYPPPTQLAQVPLGYAKKDFPLPFSEQASLELEHQVAKDLYVSFGYQWLHASQLPVYSSINGAPQSECAPGIFSGCKQFFQSINQLPPFGFVLE